MTMLGCLLPVVCFVAPVINSTGDVMGTWSTPVHPCTKVRTGTTGGQQKTKCPSLTLKTETLHVKLKCSLHVWIDLEHLQETQQSPVAFTQHLHSYIKVMVQLVKVELRYYNFVADNILCY